MCVVNIKNVIALHVTFYQTLSLGWGLACETRQYMRYM